MPRPTTPLLLATLLAAAALGESLWRWRTSNALDYYQFWVVARAVGKPETGNIYAEAERRRSGEEALSVAERSGTPARLQVARERRLLDTTGSPFLYTLFSLVALDDYEAAYRLFQLLCAAALAAGLLLTARAAGHDAVGALLLLAVVPLLEPYQSDLRVGNVNQLQLLGLGLLAWLLRGPARPWRDAAAGALLGLLLLFKPNLFAVALLLPLSRLRDRDLASLGRSLLGAVGAASAGVLASALRFGTLHCFGDWLSALGELAQKRLPIQLGNFALADLLAVDEVPVAPLLTLLSLGAAALCVLRSRLPRPERDQLALALGAAQGLIGAPLVWMHYHLLLVPLLVLLTRPGARLRLRGAAVASLPLLAVTPLAIALGQQSPTFVAAEVGLATLLLYGSGLYALLC